MAAASTITQAEELDVTTMFRAPRRIAFHGKMRLLDEENGVLVDDAFTLVDMDTGTQHGCFSSIAQGEDFLEELRATAPDHPAVKSTKVTWLPVKGVDKPPKKEKPAPAKKPRQLLFHITKGPDSNWSAEYISKIETLEQAVRFMREDTRYLNAELRSHYEPVVVYHNLGLLGGLVAGPGWVATPLEANVATVLTWSPVETPKDPSTHANLTSMEAIVDCFYSTPGGQFHLFVSDAALPLLTSLFGDALERALEEPKALKPGKKQKAAQQQQQQQEDGGEKPAKRRRTAKSKETPQESPSPDPSPASVAAKEIADIVIQRILEPVEVTAG
jgi:hypothetical protein